jgi:protein SCO1/2/putative membrane protein
MTALVLLIAQESLDWPVPEFSLTDQNGRTVTRESLRGRVWIADFIFTICRGPCPAMSLQMKEMQADLPADIALVSFSVDPVRDTPAVLKDYADQLKADHDRWRFLTGDKELIFTLAIQGFKSPTADPEKGSDQVIHSTLFYLVDKRGRIVRYYSYDWMNPRESAATMEKLRSDARSLRDRFDVYGWLPTVNATLNATSAVLLLIGLCLIKAKKISAHKACMISACLVSIAFLASYLVYHAEVGSVKYQGQGPIRTVYFSILISHTVLAVVIVPLVVMTLWRALRGSFEKHRAAARITLPIWLYVSVTGVIVYFMLYHA